MDYYSFFKENEITWLNYKTFQPWLFSSCCTVHLLKKKEELRYIKNKTEPATLSQQKHQETSSIQNNAETESKYQKTTGQPKCPKATAVVYSEPLNPP
jgi:hypothetical protein